MPEVVTFTQARRNWATLLGRVATDHNPLIITRHKAKPVVVMALEDYESAREYVRRRWVDGFRDGVASDML